MVRSERVGARPDPTRLFIADVADHRVRVVDLVSARSRPSRGTGRRQHSVTGGPASRAACSAPVPSRSRPPAWVTSRAGQGSTLRRVDPGTGVINTVAGTGARGYSGDDGPAPDAVFDAPEFTLEPAATS